VEANTWPIMAYAAYLPQTFYAYGSLGYTLNLYNMERNIIFAGINRTAKSSPTGNQFNAYGEAGYDLKTSPMIVTPVVSLAYSSLWVGSFTEGGAGALDLKVAPQYADSLQTGVGAKLTVPLKVKSAKVLPQIYATYQHEFLDGTRGIDARLSQAGSPAFGLQSDHIGRDFAVVGADVTVVARKNCALQLNYNAQVGRDRATAHLINAGLRWEF
jgi:outer membrane autotransporter protein